MLEIINNNTIVEHGYIYIIYLVFYNTCVTF